MKGLSSLGALETRVASGLQVATGRIQVAAGPALRDGDGPTEHVADVSAGLSGPGPYAARSVGVADAASSLSRPSRAPAACLGPSQTQRP